MKMNTFVDVRDVLPAISAPTVVMHRTDDLDANVEEGRWIAGAHPGGAVPGVARRRPLVVDAGPGRHHRRDRGVRHRRQRRRRSPTGCSRPCCSPTSSARPSGSARSATAAGASCWAGTTRSYGASSPASAAARSTPPATASSPPSTARRGRSGARGAIRDAVRPLGLEIRAGLHTGECERHRRQGRRHRGAHRRARIGALRRGRRGARLEHGARTWSPARASPSRTAASTTSRESATAGSTRSSTPEPAQPSAAGCQAVLPSRGS